MSWLLPTCNRPKMCREVVDACAATGMAEPAILYIDGDETGYDFELPANFTRYVRTPRAGLSAAHQWHFLTYPQDSYYGFLADDCFPKTNGWDKILVEAAGRWKISYANDAWISHNKRGLLHLQEGREMSAGVVWGGDLVRAVGWLALPGTHQGGTDVAWMHGIAEPMKLHAYRHDVIVWHKHHKAGMRPRDDTDNDSPDDVGHMRGWLKSEEPAQVRARVYQAREAAGCASS